MLKIGNDISSFSTYFCQPKTKKELFGIIKSRIDKHGVNCNLNDIDVSLITDMTYLFYMSKFNGDISEWNVNNVEDMDYMFYESSFNGDISKWDVSKVINMEGIFFNSPLEKNPPKWYKKK